VTDTAQLSPRMLDAVDTLRRWAGPYLADGFTRQRVAVRDLAYGDVIGPDLWREIAKIPQGTVRSVVEVFTSSLYKITFIGGDTVEVHYNPEAGTPTVDVLRFSD
jgi:allophanate hydrolase subunit 1